MPSRFSHAPPVAAQGRDIINLGIGQPDFRTPDFIVEAAIKALRDGHHGYTPAVGILPLREAVAADLFKRFKVSVSPDEVMILPGGKPTMFMSILMFGEPGADILYPDPGFPIYRSMIEYTARDPSQCPFASKTISLSPPRRRSVSSLRRRGSSSSIRPPTRPGRDAKAEVDKLVAGLEKFPDIAVMSDEIYDHMVYDGETHVCLLSYPSIRDRLILLNGWSKTYAMTGWRLGYAIWPGKLYDYARKLAVNLHSCVNASAQYAGLAALTGPQDEVTKMVAEFDDGGSLLSRASIACRAHPARRPRAHSTHFRTSRGPAGRQKRSPPRFLKTPALRSLADQTLASSAKAMCGCRTPIRPKISSKRLTAWASFWPAARRREPSRFLISAKHYVVCVSRKPTMTIASPMSCEMLGTSPSARNPISNVKGGTSDGYNTARLAPSSTTARVKR